MVKRGDKPSWKWRPWPNQISIISFSDSLFNIMQDYQGERKKKFVRPGQKYVFKSMSCKGGQQKNENITPRPSTPGSLPFHFLLTVTADMSPSPCSDWRVVPSLLLSCVPSGGEDPRSSRATPAALRVIGDEAFEELKNATAAFAVGVSMIRFSRKVFHGRCFSVQNNLLQCSLLSP